MVRLLALAPLRLGSLALAGLLLSSVPLPTWAAAPASARRTQALVAPATITGLWAFTTNDTPDNLVHFTLVLRQQGTRLVGYAGAGEPVYGTVNGPMVTFTVYGVSSEDDYGGSGTLGPNERLLRGSFWDGYGFSGVFAGVKLASAH